MSTELARNDYASSSLDSRMKYAGTLAHAGDLIPTGLRTQGQPNQGKILLVMETGAMLGIHPVAALQGVHVIEGKATISPALMSAVVRRSGHLLQVKMTGTIKDETVRATATLIRKDDPDNPFVVTWDLDRARRAGLYPAKSGSAWHKYTEAMLKARAISEVCREGATDALMGVGYVPEELGAEVDAEGQVIEMPSTPVRQDAPQEPQDAPGRAEEPQATQGSPEPQNEPQMLPSGLYDLESIIDLERCRETFKAARKAGHLGYLIQVSIPGSDDFEEMPLGQWLIDLGEGFKMSAPQEEIVEAEIVQE